MHYAKGIFAFDSREYLDAIDLFHKLRNANRELIAEAKQIEKSDLERAAQMYKEAISKIQQYAFIDYERGLVGNLLAEESQELGWNGEVEALERLTLCLFDLGEIREAARMTDEYFTTYRRDLLSGAAKRIKRRLAKAVARNQRSAP